MVGFRALEFNYDDIYEVTEGHPGTIIALCDVLKYYHENSENPFSCFAKFLTKAKEKNLCGKNFWIFYTEQEKDVKNTIRLIFL